MRTASVLGLLIGLSSLLAGNDAYAQRIVRKPGDLMSPQQMQDRVAKLDRMLAALSASDEEAREYRIERAALIDRLSALGTPPKSTIRIGVTTDAGSQYRTYDGPSKDQLIRDRERLDAANDKLNTDIAAYNRDLKAANGTKAELDKRREALLRRTADIDERRRALQLECDLLNASNDVRNADEYKQRIRTIDGNGTVDLKLYNSDGSRNETVLEAAQANYLKKLEVFTSDNSVNVNNWSRLNQEYAAVTSRFDNLKPRLKQIESRKSEISSGYKTLNADVSNYNRKH